MSYEHPINWQYRESQRFGTSVNRNQQIGTISRYVRLCHASSVHVRTEIIIWNKCVYIRCQKFNFSPFALTIKNSKTSWSFIRVITFEQLSPFRVVEMLFKFHGLSPKVSLRIVSVTNHDFKPSPWKFNQQNFSFFPTALSKLEITATCIPFWERASWKKQKVGKF